MSVKIRLKRVGAKKRPMYRVVVTDSRSPRDGKNIATLGSFNPMVNPPELKIDHEKVNAWISKGALPTPTVKKLIKDSQASLAGTTGAAV